MWFIWIFVFYFADEANEFTKVILVNEIDLSKSSILLTPEPSPAKDKDGEKKDNVETCSNSSTEQPKCKQVGIFMGWGGGRCT